jgi:hypothetical protein
MECQSNAKPSEMDHDLPGTFGLAVSIANLSGPQYSILISRKISISFLFNLPDKTKKKLYAKLKLELIEYHAQKLLHNN